MDDIEIIDFDPDAFVSLPVIQGPKGDAGSSITLGLVVGLSLALG